MKTSQGSARHVIPWIFAILFLSLSGCGTNRRPLDKIRAALERYPEYSVILEDMMEKGLFFKDYYHLYRIIWVESEPAKSSEHPAMRERVTEWIPVDKATYDKYRSCLGMTILAKKKNGTIDTVPQPPGYQYVGDPRYGHWRTDSNGSRFWEWYGKYLFFRTLFGGLGSPFGYGPIRYRDWSDYRTTVGRGVPYYGRTGTSGQPRFGTQGTLTRKTHPSFFKRQQARMAAKKRSFFSKARSRYGRSRVSGFRSRSGGFGK